MKQIKVFLYSLLLIIILSITVGADDMSVHFLDVGQGLAICVESDGQTLI